MIDQLLRLQVDWPVTAFHVPSSLLHEFAHINVTVMSEAIMKYSVYDVFASDTASSVSLLRVFSAIQQATFNRDF